jgi:hypothetical protein
LLAKSDSCGIFCCILRKSCFSATPRMTALLKKYHYCPLLNLYNI